MFNNSLSMGQKELDGFFEKFLQQDPLFVNKQALQGNYTPKNLPHREDQINLIAGVLAPALRMEKPSNIFIYGKTGTGKSLCINYISSYLLTIAEKNNIPLKIIYLNCKLKRVADTEYRLIAHLTRLNTELTNSEVTLIGISNDLLFVDNIDPRVKSSLSEEELVFPPYNAMQLQGILKQRAKLAFRKDVIDEGVIEKCAAYAARDHGDARRALELLRVAGEISERKNENKIKVEHIDEAEDKIERDRVLEQVNSQPKQFKLTLYSIFSVCSNNNNGHPIFTGDIYEVYKDACQSCGLKPLTQRRVSDIIAELDMLGIINAKVISKGRYGRTREIRLAIPS